MKSLDKLNERAIAMLTSPRTAEAFDLSKEPQALRAEDLVALERLPVSALHDVDARDLAPGAAEPVLVVRLAALRASE